MCFAIYIEIEIRGEAVVALEAELDEGEQEDLCPNDGTHA